MKKIPVLAILITLALGACKKEKLVITDIDEYVTISGGASTSFDVEYKPAAHVDFIVDTKDGANISEIKVYKQYIGAGGSISGTVLHQTLNAFPATVNATLTQALSGLGINIADFNKGDKVVFTIVITADNKEYNSNLEFEGISVCPSNLAGTYKVVTTYTQHDFLPTFSTITDTVTITEVSAGKYSVQDLSGGLYSKGPYKGAYGTSGIKATLEDTCNAISWTGVADPWGQVLPAPGGTNAVAGNTGVITISWRCAAYNEQGVSVYTPM